MTAADPLADLQPFLILRRRDGSLAVAARALGNVISLAPLVGVPDPPRKRLLECCCCRRAIILNEFKSGMTTLTPLPKTPRDHDGGDGL